MPIRAFIDEKEIIASYLDTDEWNGMKQDVKTKKLNVIMPCCRSKGNMKRSKLGTQYFAHNPKTKANCAWKPESIEHINAKNEILLACRDEGFTAHSEYTGLNWIADVYAEKDNRKIAFEVQWSSQTIEITQERQDKYRENGIKGCWFFGKIPLLPGSFQSEIVSEKLPMFEIKLNANKEIVVLFQGEEIGLRSFVCSLLAKKIKFCKLIRFPKKQIFKVVFPEIECWKCGEKYNIYMVNEGTKSSCDCALPVHQVAIPGVDLSYFSPTIMEAVSSFLETEKGKHYQIGKIKKRYSKTQDSSYMSFGCPHCDAIFGEFYLMEVMIDYAYETGIGEDITIEYPEDIKIECPHWCHPKNGDFCV